MKDYSSVIRFLDDLTNEELIRLGTELGLLYSHLKRMNPVLDTMVADWLNTKDNILSTSGRPSWASLITALKNIDHSGVANKIGMWIEWLLKHFCFCPFAWIKRGYPLVVLIMKEIKLSSLESTLLSQFGHCHNFGYRMYFVFFFQNCRANELKLIAVQSHLENLRYANCFPHLYSSNCTSSLKSGMNLEHCKARKKIVATDNLGMMSVSTLVPQL